MAKYNDVFEAAEKGTLEDVKYFIEQEGVDVNAKSSSEHSVLEFAWLGKNAEIIKYLILKGGDIERYWIIDAATLEKGSTELIQLFLDRGIGVNYRDSGMFPLLLAAGTNNIEAARYLLLKGADINMESSATGLTPLQLAKKNGHTEMVNFLTEQMDKTSIGLCVLSLIIPLVGIILFLVWIRITPRKAKACGIAALIGIIVYFILPHLFN